MNCIKCPIFEECGTNKLTDKSVYSQSSSLPVVVIPYNKEDCPLIKAIEETREAVT